MILRLTDGLIVVSLHGGGSTTLGCTYMPLTPTEKESRTTRAGDEGEELSDIHLANVTESAEVILEGTPAAIRSTVQTINRLLNAPRMTRKYCYVEYSPDDNDVYRSRVVKGRVVWPTVPGRRRLDQTTTTVSIQVLWERYPFWEGAEVQLRTSALNQPLQLGGRTVRNHYDGTYGNYVDIPASQILGDLPAPVRVMLQNNSGGTIFPRNFYFSANWDNLVLFSHAIQGESVRAGYGTTFAESSCSGGAYTKAVFSGTYWLHYDLSQQLLNAAAGRRFKLLARFFGYTSAPPTIYVQPELRDQNLATLVWQGDEIPLPAVSSSGIVDLGRAVPLPPGGWSNNWAPLVLSLKLRAATVGSPGTELEFAL